MKIYIHKLYNLFIAKLSSVNGSYIHLYHVDTPNNKVPRRAPAYWTRGIFTNRFFEQRTLQHNGTGWGTRFRLKFCAFSLCHRVLIHFFRCLLGSNTEMEKFITRQRSMNLNLPVFENTKKCRIPGFNGPLSSISKNKRPCF